MDEPTHSLPRLHVQPGSVVIWTDAVEIIAEIGGANFSEEESIEHARLIVIAVNAHAELLAAAKEVRHINLNLTRLDNDFSEKLSKVENILQAAIRKAEEPAP